LGNYCRWLLTPMTYQKSTKYTFQLELFVLSFIEDFQPQFHFDVIRKRNVFVWSFQQEIFEWKGYESTFPWPKDFSVSEHLDP
jgi:hypothetical protein